MAKKKSARKTASKPAAKQTSKKAGKKTTAKKAGSRKPAAKNAAKPGRGLAPAAVKTGPGPAPMEIGQSLVGMFNQGQFAEIEAKWWNPREITSVEGVGVAMAWTGRAAVDAKNHEWMNDHVIHGASAEGPFVGASGFAVRFRMDVETKSTGVRQVMDEVGVYTVKNGKIVREEFMYSMGG